MKTVLLLLAAIFAMSACASAGDTEEDPTRSVVRVDGVGYVVSNGKAWQTLDMQNRIIYLQGIEEGMRLVLLTAAQQNDPRARVGIKTINRDLSISGFVFSDLVQQVNRFYSDSANLKIPVVEAYAFVIRKMKGALPGALSEAEAALRATYNK